MTKTELTKWRKEIDEISNCVWKVTLIHESGSCIEQTGTNLEQLEKQVRRSAIEINKQIEKK